MKHKITMPLVLSVVSILISVYYNYSKGDVLSADYALGLAIYLMVAHICIRQEEI